jgi:putative ABC transport system substrate-binding protein
MARIGYLAPVAQANQPAAWLDALHEGLGAAGYVEGRTIAFEYRFADNHLDRLPDFATELVRQNVDVIVAPGTPAVQAARRATSTIPIVMPYIGDPVELGFVTSLAHPDGNITGLTTQSPDLAPKRLQVLKDSFPKLSRVGFLFNPDNPSFAAGFREAEGAARTLGLRTHALEVRASDLATPLATAVAEQIDALVVIGSTSLAIHRDAILDFAVKQLLPVMYDAREWIEYGGLMSYGVNFTDLYRRAATYVDKILKGARTGDLPIERPTSFDFVINVKAAQAIGLTLPQSILAQASEVIQ